MKNNAPCRTHNSETQIYQELKTEKEISKLKMVSIFQPGAPIITRISFQQYHGLHYHFSVLKQ